jgi:hypothetical protein
MSMSFGGEILANAFQSGSVLYFIDKGIGNYQSIVASLPTHAEVIYLDEDRNGISQITEALARFNNVSGIHIFSHGAPSS